MVTKTALVFGKSLLFLTFRTTAIHFSAIKIILKKQAAARAFSGSRFNRGFTTWNWTFKNGFAVAAPIFPLEGCLTLLTSFNGHYLLQNLKLNFHHLYRQVHIIVDKALIAKGKTNHRQFLTSGSPLQPMGELSLNLISIAKVQLQ